MIVTDTELFGRTCDIGVEANWFLGVFSVTAEDVALAAVEDEEANVGVIPCKDGMKNFPDGVKAKSGKENFKTMRDGILQRLHRVELRRFIGREQWFSFEEEAEDAWDLLFEELTINVEDIADSVAKLWPDLFEANICGEDYWVWQANQLVDCEKLWPEYGQEFPENREEYYLRKTWPEYFVSAA
jgi:hypothetical protein